MKKAAIFTANYAATKDSTDKAKTSFTNAGWNFLDCEQTYNIGGESLDKRYFDDAIAIARKGLQIEPYGTAIRVQLAQALLSQGKIKEAVEILEYCVRIDPTGGQAALLLAKAYHKQGRDAEALALLRAVEAAIPGQLGIAEAIAALEASVTAAP